MNKHAKITVESSDPNLVEVMTRAIGLNIRYHGGADMVRFTGLGPAGIGPAGMTEAPANFAKDVAIEIVGRRSPTQAFFSALSKFAKRKPGEDVTLADDEIQALMTEVDKGR